MWAGVYGHEEAARLLIEKGADACFERQRRADRFSLGGEK